MNIVTGCSGKLSQDATRKRDPDANSRSAVLHGELDSSQLFGEANEIHIRHGGDRYTLRRTSKGKLILTK